MCKHRAYMVEWRAANREEARKIANDCYARNAEARREKARQHRLANLENARAYDRARGHRSYGKEKDLARAAVRRAVARGDLVRQPCEVCGVPNAEGHHDDYAKQLDVRWLCRTHHMELHRWVAA